MIPKSVVATSSDNPTNLPPRYEIRQLTVEHTEWAIAVWLQPNLFHSPVWTAVYRKNLAQRLFASVDPARDSVKHALASGMSFGVFDTEYKFRRPSSKESGGALYWDELRDSPDASSAELLDRMDFPLVSIALGYDMAKAVNMEKLMDLFVPEAMPLWGVLYQAIEQRDPRGTSYKPKVERQVLNRSGTSTRPDYEGEHLMSSLSRFYMREAKLRGYKGIQIMAAHDAVAHVWSNPPAPFKSEVIVEFDTGIFEQDGQRPFAPSKQVCRRIYVTL